MCTKNIVLNLIYLVSFATFAYTVATITVFLITPPWFVFADIILCFSFQSIWILVLLIGLIYPLVILLAITIYWILIIILALIGNKSKKARTASLILILFFIVFDCVFSLFCISAYWNIFAIVRAALLVCLCVKYLVDWKRSNKPTSFDTKIDSEQI